MNATVRQLRTRRFAPLASVSAIALTTLALVAGCATGNANLPKEPGTNPRLTPFTYLEEGKLVALSVDAQAASRRDDQALIPLPVAVANKGLDRLTLTRESFTLVDEAGNRYPMATVAEMRKLGNLTTNDYQVSEFFFETSSTTYMNWNYQNATFFPLLRASRLSGGGPVVSEKVELVKHMWTSDILYFPHPKGSIHGKKLELWMSSPDLTEPVFVKFRIQ